MTLLKAENISCGYGSGDIVSGVSLELKSGEILSVAGKNGCGKTTLLRCLCGIIKPSSGHIEIDGEDISPLMGKTGVSLPKDSSFLSDLRRGSIRVIHRFRYGDDGPIPLYDRRIRLSRCGRCADSKGMYGENQDIKPVITVYRRAFGRSAPKGVSGKDLCPAAENNIAGRACKPYRPFGPA